MDSEQTRKQIILVIDGPIAGEAEAFLQPEHRLEARDCSSRCLEGLEAADLRHVLLHAEVVAFDTLLKMLGNIVNRIEMQVPVIDGRLDR